MDEYAFYCSAVGVWLAVAVVVFVVLFLKTAPYGRFTRTGWGPMVSSKLGWIVMDSPAVLLFGLLFLIGDRKGPGVRPLDRGEPGPPGDCVPPVVSEEIPRLPAAAQSGDPLSALKGLTW